MTKNGFKLPKSTPVCDDPDGIQGIMSYRNDCNFMKVPGDNGNLADAPEIVEAANDGQGTGTANHSFGGQTWLSDQGVPILTPNSARMSGFGESNGESQDASGSPDGGNSNNGPTPNSSTGAGSDSRGRLAPGQMNGSGRNSFQASPIIPQQNMMNTSGVETTNAGFFGAPNGFTMPATMHDHGFSVPSGWDNMQGQTEMPQVGDGVLRALMNMGPMDAMDLSSWDSGNENLR